MSRLARGGYRVAHLEPEAAAARIREVITELLPLPKATFVFKKIDSRLKGNVAVEVKELAAGLRRSEVLFCPAVPEAGRLVEGGAFKDLVSGGTITLPDFGASLNASCPDVRTTAELDRVARAFCDSATHGVAVGARIGRKPGNGICAQREQRSGPSPGTADLLRCRDQ